MNEADIDPLDEDVRGLVRQAATAAANVPVGARSRVLARVDSAIGPGGGPPGGAPGVSAPPSPAGMRGLGRLLPVAAAFLVGGLTGAWLARATVSPAPLVVYVDRVIPQTPAAATPAVGPVPVAVSPPVVATTPQPSRPASTPSASVTGAPGQLAAERLLLDGARHALEQEDGAAALDATTRHERLYPNGVLTQEREAMAIRALAQLGRDGDARARAARFRARFPDSMLLPAVQAAVGGG